MKTAAIYLDRSGRSFKWSANYPQGGIDLLKCAIDIRRAKHKPYIPIGKCHENERTDDPLRGFTDLVRRQGYQTREQAEYGARVKKLDNKKTEVIL